VDSGGHRQMLIIDDPRHDSVIHESSTASSSSNVIEFRWNSLGQQLSCKHFSKHAIHPDRGAITGKVDVSGLNAVRMMPQLSKETR
jgi:hypothetical protein